MKGTIDGTEASRLKNLILQLIIFLWDIFFMLKSQITEVAEIFRAVILSFISDSHNNYKISRGIM